MVQVTVERGMPLEVLISKIQRENGLHVIQIHNGAVVRHALLERVQNEGWIMEAMKTSPKRSGKAKEEPDEVVK